LYFLIKDKNTTQMLYFLDDFWYNTMINHIT